MGPGVYLFMKKGRIPLPAFLSILFLLFAGAGLIMIHGEYNNYREKLDILYQMTGSDLTASDTEGTQASGSEGTQDSGGQDTQAKRTQAAADILRGRRSGSVERGRQALEAYGYGGDYQDVYRKNFQKSACHILLTVLAGYVCTLALIICLLRNREKLFQKNLADIGETLAAFRDGNYRIAPSLESVGSLTALYENLSSLGKYLEITTAKAKTEEEKTKSIVTDLSHQIKTPLTALTTSIGILKDEDLAKEEFKTFIEMSEAQVDRLNELLSSMIQISRLESGLIELAPVESPVVDTIRTALSRVYPDASAKQIEIELDTTALSNKPSDPETLSNKPSDPEILSNKPDVPAEKLLLKHDKKWLSEALINILDNDVKYSDSHTTITIRLIRLPSFLKIEIEDQGPGISREERIRIFKRFYRGEQAAKQQKAGSGVGLYLTKKIVDMHGGTIRVAAPKGKKQGSVFVIQLPV